MSQRNPSVLIPASAHGTTDEQGRFEMPFLLPGDYLVLFDLSNSGCVTQYYPGQVDPNKAGWVTVVAGRRTEIADTLLPTSSASGPDRRGSRRGGRRLGL